MIFPVKIFYCMQRGRTQCQEFDCSYRAKRYGPPCKSVIYSIPLELPPPSLPEKTVPNHKPKSHFTLLSSLCNSVRALLKIHGFHLNVNLIYYSQLLKRKISKVCINLIACQFFVPLFSDLF